MIMIGRWLRYQHLTTSYACWWWWLFFPDDHPHDHDYFYDDPEDHDNYFDDDWPAIYLYLFLYFIFVIVSVCPIPCICICIWFKLMISIRTCKGPLETWPKAPTLLGPTYTALWRKPLRNLELRILCLCSHFLRYELFQIENIWEQYFVSFTFLQVFGSSWLSTGGKHFQ